MRLAHTLGGSSGGSECETYEFAEEAKQTEPLRFMNQQIVTHALASEFARVCRQPIDGMYIVPSGTDHFQWLGLLFIRRGVFGGGIFRFNLKIPSDFPMTDSLPIVTFDMDIFHPQIDGKTRRLDVARYFPDGWKKNKHHIQNILLVVQRLFFSFDFDHDSCANPDAARMWKEYEHKFRDIAKDCVNQSRIQIYDDPQDINDPNSIRLTPWDPSVHEPVRERMMMLGSNHRGEGSSWGERSSERRGFSWIDTEEMTYMTESMSSKSNIDQDNSILKAENDRLMHGIEKLDLSGVLNDDSSEWSTKSQRSINQSPLPSSNVSNLIDEHVELEKIVSDHEAHEERVK